ncbi:hypothetical protein [Bacillus altitudinis]|uniref:hypothetical protein n=1 Tax=Bacillus altitudinis TaxID=293387 RepID=UPI0021007E40|nr:hypothetical protein [Bacillus altitudinis]UTV34844.1 hypothetical protein NM966_19820 [Bacillus altitudinis]
MKRVWQPPLFKSETKGHDRTSSGAKYHAFVNNVSLCGLHSQQTDEFDIEVFELQIVAMPELACKKCLKKVGIK